MRLSVYANFHIFVYTIILHVYIFGFFDRRKWNRGGSTAAAEYTPEKEKRYLRRPERANRGVKQAVVTPVAISITATLTCFSLSVLTMHSKCDSDRLNRSCLPNNENISWPYKRPRLVQSQPIILGARGVIFKQGAGRRRTAASSASRCRSVICRSDSDETRM